MRRRLHHYTVIGFITVFLLFGGVLTHTKLQAADYVSPRPYHRTSLLTGFTYPKRVVDVASEVAGKCIQVNGDVGEPIPADGVFAIIDDTFIRLDIEANTLQRERVERQLVTEKKMLRRYTTLRAENSATEAQFEEVQLSADLHELTIKDLTSQLRRLREKLARHRITAPVGWLVSKRNVEKGEFVQVGQVVARIGDFSQLVVPFSLGFTELQALKGLQKTRLYLPDLDVDVNAQLHHVSPEFSRNTKKIEVELILDGSSTLSGEQLRGGMRAQLRLPLPTEGGTYVLPLTSIINRYDAHWVLRADGSRVRVIYLGPAEGKDSGIVSSPELRVSDSLYRVIPDDF